MGSAEIFSNFVQLEPLIISHFRYVSLLSEFKEQSFVILNIALIVVLMQLILTVMLPEDKLISWSLIVNKTFDLQNASEVFLNNVFALLENMSFVKTDEDRLTNFLSKPPGNSRHSLDSYISCSETIC